VPIPDRPTVDSPDPRWRVRLTDDGSPTLVEVASGQAMHSGCGARDETRHVYLEGSGVSERLGRQQPTRVLEVGFGSGLAWLMTADRAVSNHTPLFYQALEIALPPASVIRQLDLGRFLDHPALLDAFCGWLAMTEPREASPDRPDVRLEFRFQTATLRVLLVDAVRWGAARSAALPTFDDERFDAVYFDPYSPEAAPQLWTAEIFAVMFGELQADGRLVTYCVSRAVRDALATAGFAVRRVPGPAGGKREVLIASPAVSPPSHER
jgi:tRNA U34 5-methylaminomethyl-2-thiouridine-forming methyltransferase MnmC